MDKDSISQVQKVKRDVSDGCSIDYLASLGTTPIVDIEIYNEQDSLIANYSNKIPGVLLELSDRLENLLIGGNIERTIRAVITYVDPE